MDKPTIRRLALAALSEPAGLGILDLEERDESWAPYLRFLHLCVKEFGIRFALELGTFNGTSALHMALASPDVFVITIDKSPQVEGIRTAAAHKNIWLLIGYSTRLAWRVGELYKKLGPIDLLFLDTEHDGALPREEFLTYRDYLADEALVVVDDLLGPEHLREKMQAFWEWLPGEKIELHDLHPRRVAEGIAYHDAPGFGVSIVRRQDEL